MMMTMMGCRDQRRRDDDIAAHIDSGAPVRSRDIGAEGRMNTQKRAPMMKAITTSSRFIFLQCRNDYASYGAT